MSEEALQIAEERREAKSKGKKGRIYLNECRIQENNMKEKKTFLNEQCEEVEENNRMGKTDLFNKMGYIKGTFHARMGTVKDRNHKDLTEAEEIKMGWQEYTEELYKKGFNDLITTMV